MQERLFYRDMVPELVVQLKREILSGLVVNGKTYYLLAYSSSQLKEGSFWMVCPPGSWNVQMIIGKLGDFSSSKSRLKVSRFAVALPSIPNDCDRIR